MFADLFVKFEAFMPCIFVKLCLIRLVFL